MTTRSGRPVTTPAAPTPTNHLHNNQSAAKPYVWTRALRDQLGVTGTRLFVLWALADRLGGSEGFCSVAQLMHDCAASKATVHRVLQWARAEGLIIQTSRGHGTRGGKPKASTYRLVLPDPRCDRRDPGVTRAPLIDGTKVSPEHDLSINGAGPRCHQEDTQTNVTKRTSSKSNVARLDKARRQYLREAGDWRYQ